MALAEVSYQVVAIVTAMPLKSDADVLKDAEQLFSMAGEKVELYYYFGAFIALSGYRNLKIAKTMESQLEIYARNFGYSKLCLSSVIRKGDDPREPLNYISSDAVWKNMGFSRTKMQLTYHWPTLLENGGVSDINNEMQFWIKEIS